MAKKRATAAENVKKSNERRNMKQVNLRLNPDEMKLLTQLETAYGGKKGALMAGLTKLKGGNAAESLAVAEALRKLANEIDPT
ncbi:MAG: hypothetical protein ABJL57_11635 [Hyphomonas sp.]|uniref:hypothetical protein n=1 Tax=Hyphomonas sp. TaxID=87 RepID=UPI003263E234